MQTDQDYEECGDAPGIQAVLKDLATKNAAHERRVAELEVRVERLEGAEVALRSLTRQLEQAKADVGNQVNRLINHLEQTGNGLPNFRKIQRRAKKSIKLPVAS